MFVHFPFRCCWLWQNTQKHQHPSKHPGFLRIMFFIGNKHVSSFHWSRVAGCCTCPRLAYSSHPQSRWVATSPEVHITCLPETSEKSDDWIPSWWLEITTHLNKYALFSTWVRIFPIIGVKIKDTPMSCHHRSILWENRFKPSFGFASTPRLSAPSFPMDSPSSFATRWSRCSSSCSWPCKKTPGFCLHPFFWLGCQKEHL